MNHQHEDAYLQAKRNRLRLFYRLGLGMHQLIVRPYTIAVPILLIFLFTKLWESKWINFYFKSIPSLLLPLYQYIIAFGIILIPLIFLFGFLHFLGDITAIQDEANLVVAFTEKDLRNGHPLLIKRRKIKGTDVTIREFHSSIPMKIWKERKEELADQMNVRFVEPCIEYGGKTNSTGNKIRLYTAPERKRPERGDLYDSEL